MYPFQKLDLMQNISTKHFADLVFFDIGLTEVEYIKNAFEEIGMKK